MVRYRPFVLFRSAPGHIQLPFIPHAIRQIQVNQRLIGDAGGGRLPLEVLNGIDMDRVKLRNHAGVFPADEKTVKRS